MTRGQTAISILSVIMVLAVFLCSAAAVFADGPVPPSDPDQSWTPPEGDGNSYMAPGAKSSYESSPAPSSGSTAPSSASSSYYPPPGMPPSILSAGFLDESGRLRTKFSNEPFYLRMQTNSPGYFYLAEYFPKGSGMSPQWLMYRYELDRAGSWVFGPFYPDAYEPDGQHTWRMWLYNAGSWTQQAAYFDYQPYQQSSPIPSPDPQAVNWGMAQIIIIMVLVGALGVTIGMLISGKRKYSS